METRVSSGEEDKYIELVDPGGQLHIEVQSVSHPSRVHLDIESDDVEAEIGGSRVSEPSAWRRSTPGGARGSDRAAFLRRAREDVRLWRECERTVHRG